MSAFCQECRSVTVPGGELGLMQVELCHLHANTKALRKALELLVGECEAEFTLDGYWNDDSALVRRKTVQGAKKTLAATKETP